MPRNSNHNAVGCIALVVASLLWGCATSPPTPPKQADQPVPAPGPVVTVAEAPAPTAPPAPLAPPTVPAVPDIPEVTRPERPEPPPPPPSTEPPVPAAQRGRFVVLNFDNADVETVIHAASEIVGFNYVLAPDVRGKVTVQTSGRIPQEDVFGVLLAILEVNGFTAVKSGNLYKIVKIEGARERAVPTIVGSTADPARTTDEIITQIVTLRYASVNDASTLLRPLISQRGTLIAHRETNVLVITDTASNVRRLLDIVKQIDVQVALEELQIIQLRYADAGQTATVLTQLFQRGVRQAAAFGVPGAPVLPTTPAVAPAAPPGGAPGGPAVSGTTTERPPLIVAEARSNSLIVYGRRNDIEMIRRLINQLDINVGGGRRVFIYYAENAKAKDLAATLNAIYTGRETTPTGVPSPTAPRPGGAPLLPPSPPPTVAPGLPLGAAAGFPGAPLGDLSFAEGQVRFIADETTNAVIVTTLPRLYPEIESTIKQLDKMPRQVLIEVLVAEIALNDDTKLGMDWALRTGKFTIASVSRSDNIPSTTAIGPGGGTPGIGAPGNILPRPGGAALLGPIGAGLTAFAFSSDQFFAILNTLADQNRVNVISNPHILTSENKKAIINVSDSVPIVTSQQTGTITPVQTAGTTSLTTTTGSVNQTVEYRDAGVVLTVTPRIGEHGTVALDVKQEVNSVGAATPPTGSPSFQKREAETSVVLLNNQTLVLGGLIKDQVTIEDRGIPYLKNIPLLGFAFGFKRRAITRTELLMLITPRVIGNLADAQRVTEHMRKATKELEDAIRNAPKPPPPTTTPPVPPAPTVPPALTPPVTPPAVTPPPAPAPVR